MCCRLRVFCCGCTLQAGAITAAVFNALFVLSMVIAGAQFFVFADWLEDPEGSPPFIFGFNSYMNMREQNYQMSSDFNKKFTTKDDKEVRETATQILRIAGGVCLGITFFALVIFICLVVAIVKKISCLLWPWLIAYMIKIVISCILMIVTMIALVFPPLVVLGASVAFDIYMWIVVYNYHRELRLGPQYETQPNIAKMTTYPPPGATYPQGVGYSQPPVGYPQPPAGYQPPGYPIQNVGYYPPEKDVNYPPEKDVNYPPPEFSKA